jgi:hypothetical protein
MKTRSLKQLSERIVQSQIGKWQHELACNDPNRKFDIVSLKLKLTPWIEAISNITDAQIQDAMEHGSPVTILSSPMLPGDVKIIKQVHASTMASKFVDEHDKRQSHNIPTEKLFTPSLFPNLDYEDVRKRWLTLGETNRVMLGEAAPEQWRMNDGIKRTNFAAQQAAFNRDAEVWARREQLWQLNPECRNTDELIRKLGGWK